MDAPVKKPRGFAAMSPEKRRELASMGGKKAHELGVANSFTPEAARAAGKKGGASLSQNREHMAEIGLRGAIARKNKDMERRLDIADAAVVAPSGT